MSISARYSGVCKATGRRYPEGAAVTKTEHGWAIDDGVTAAALAAVTGATHTLRKCDRDYFGDPTGFTGWEVGQVVADRDGIWTVLLVSSTSGHDEEEGGEWKTGWTAKVRPATDEESASILERRAAKAARRALLEERAAAEKALLALPREQVADWCNRQPDGWNAQCSLTESHPLGRTYSPPSWTVYLYADGSVYLSHYNPDWDAVNATYRLVDPSPEVHELARTAAWQIFENGNPVPVKDIEDPDRVPYYDEPVIDQVD